MNSFYYLILFLLMTLICISDARKRYVKEHLLLRVPPKSGRKQMVKFFAAEAFLLMATIFFAFMRIELVNRIMAVLIGLEGMYIAFLVYRQPIILTASHIGNVFYIRLQQILFYRVQGYGDVVIFAFQRKNKKKADTLDIRSDMAQEVETIIQSFGIKKKKT